jgi:sec-independent protein translocase protein TatA
MPDWAIVAIIGVVVLFGASKLPEIARNLGRSSGEFKKGLKEGHDDAKAASGESSASDVTAPPPAPAAPEPASDEPRPGSSV